MLQRIFLQFFRNISKNNDFDIQTLQCNNKSRETCEILKVLGVNWGGKLDLDVVIGFSIAKTISTRKPVQFDDGLSNTRTITKRVTSNTDNFGFVEIDIAFAYIRDHRIRYEIDN